MGFGYNKLEINDKVYRYANSWHTLTYNQFYSLQNTTDSLEILSVLTSVEVDILRRLPNSFKDEIANSLLWLKAEMPTKPLLKYNNKKYNLPDSIHKMSIANYISCEILSKDDSQKNLSSIVSYILDNPNLESQLIVQDVIYCFKWYTDGVKQITEEYSELFPKVKKEKKVVTVEDTFNSKWGWYSILLSIVEDYRMSIREVERLTVNEVFNYLLYRKDKRQLEELKEAQAKARAKLR